MVVDFKGFMRIGKKAQGFGQMKVVQQICQGC